MLRIPKIPAARGWSLKYKNTRYDQPRYSVVGAAGGAAAADLKEDLWKVQVGHRAETQSFCMHEIHRKFVETSGKFPVVSGKLLPGVSGSLPGQFLVASGPEGGAGLRSCTEVTTANGPRSRRPLGTGVSPRNGEARNGSLRGS